MELLTLLVGVGVWIPPASLCSFDPRPAPAFKPAPGSEDCDPPACEELTESALLAAAAFSFACFLLLKRNAISSLTILLGALGRSSSYIPMRLAVATTGGEEGHDGRLATDS